MGSKIPDHSDNTIKIPRTAETVRKNCIQLADCSLTDKHE